MKSKGDKAEKEALAMLTGLAPASLLVAQPSRRYGAGQMFDKGDLDVFPDVTIQVKWLAKLAEGVRQTLDGAVAQQRNAKTELHLGLARTSGHQRERWLAVCSTWPTGDPEPRLGTHSNIPKAITAILDCDQAIGRGLRIAAVQRGTSGTFWISTADAWVDALAVRRGVR